MKQTISIDSLERKVDTFMARNMENSSRLDELKSLPTVSQQLTSVKPQLSVQLLATTFIILNYELRDRKISKALLEISK